MDKNCYKIYYQLMQFNVILFCFNLHIHHVRQIEIQFDLFMKFNLRQFFVYIFATKFNQQIYQKVLCKLSLQNRHLCELQTMKSVVVLTSVLIYLQVRLSCSVDFNGKVPLNSYTIPVAPGDVINTKVNWTTNGIDLDLHLFQPGIKISNTTSNLCGCSGSGKSQSVTITANAAGTMVVWLLQWGGSGLQYTIVIKKNGANFDGQTRFMTPNASIYKVTVTTVPCKIFINFTSTANFNLGFYTPGTSQSGSPIQSMSYTGGTGYKDVVKDLTSPGVYQLKVVQNPANPSGGWNALTYYSGSMDCKSCQDFMAGCVQCTSSATCTECLSSFTLASSKCQCALPNCQTCSNASLVCLSCSSGYFLNSSQICSPCNLIANCQLCSNQTFCTLCSGQNFFNTTLLQCRPCYEAFEDCISCDNETICEDCTPEKYFDGSQCVFCNSTMNNCLECNVSGTCLKCDIGNFANSSDKCQACSSVMAGCQECSGSSACTKCNINNILVDGSCKPCPSLMNQCLNCTAVSLLYKCTVCQPTHYVNSTDKCSRCNTSISQCQLCQTQTECTKCSWPYFLSGPQLCDSCNKILQYCLTCTSTGQTCFSCQDDRYYLMANYCQECLILINNCSRCQNQQTCLQCQSKYHLVQNQALGTIKCKSCQTSMEGCGTCLNQTFCLTELNDYYIVYHSNGSVVKCKVEMQHCITCQNQIKCTSCEVGYILEGNLCVQCSDVMQFCTRCQNRSVCQECQSDFKPNADTMNSNCTCKQGWYVPSACTLTPGCISAQKLKKTQLSTCLMCDSQRNFFYEHSLQSCSCLIGYNLSKDECVQECGDGTHFEHQCDDNNLIAGDGCSHQCKIQTQYVCQGDEYQKSRCYLKLKPQVKYLYTVRNDGENKAKIYFSIEPESYLYQRVNFTKLLKINDSRINILNAYYHEGRLQVQFSFNQSLQNQQINLNLNLSKSFNFKSQSSITFHTLPMKPPLNLLQYNQFFRFVFICGEILAYLLLFLLLFSTFFNKMIALQIILVYQTIYCLGSLSIQNISSFRVLTSLRPAVGIFKIIQGSRIQLISPQFLRFICTGKSLLLNLNISLGILLAALFAFIILNWILLKNKQKLKRYKQLAVTLKEKCISKAKLQRLKTQIQQKKMRLIDNIFHSNIKAELAYERLFYPIGMFMFLPFLIIYAASVMGSIKGQPSQIQQFSTILFECVFIILIALFSYQTRRLFVKQKQSQLKLTFRSIRDCIHKNRFNKYSSLILVFYTFNIFLSLITLGIQNLQIAIAITPITIVPISSSFYLIYLKYSQPYTNHTHNKIIIYNNVILLLFSVILIIDNYASIPEIVILILILIIFLMGYVGFILSLYRLLLEHKQILKRPPLQECDTNQRKNVKDTLQFNPYVHKENQRKNISFLADLKINGEQKEQSQDIQFQNQQQQKRAQIQKIKSRLRKQINR